MRRSCKRNNLELLCLALLGYGAPPAAAQAVAAQIASSNVNMVSGTTYPGGDPFLQRQNEPSIAVSTRNPLHLLAGANDYRTVDLPGIPDTGEDEQKRDAWLGVFKSRDGGRTWTSTLIPGFPQDNAASPLKGYNAAADPAVRAGTNGLFYYAGLVFDRNDDKSAIFIARFIDDNNTETSDPIQYLGAQRVAQSGGTDHEPFLDKPALAVDVPRAGALPCAIDSQKFPAGNVYLAYSAFFDEGAPSETSDIMFTQSRDCGVTWPAQSIRLTSEAGRNQGAAIAIDPGRGYVYVTWTRFGPAAQGNPDVPASIMMVKSIDGGQTFSTPRVVANFLALNQSLIDFFSFRTNSYPAIAVDDTGRVYIAWSEAGRGPYGEARIVVSTSTDGVSWSSARVAEPGSVAESGLDPTPGHQLMPALTFAGGKLMLVFYDTREDHVSEQLTCGDCKTLPVSYTTTYNFEGDLATSLPQQKPGISQLVNVFNGAVSDAKPVVLTRRHTIDVRAAQAAPGPEPVFTSIKVSQYLFGSSTCPNPDKSQCPSMVKPIKQLRFNPPNIPLFSGGTRAFLGDYIDVAAAPPFLPVTRGAQTFWQFNTAPSSTTVYHASWADNRDVIPPADGNWTHYTPATPPGTKSIFDPDVMRPVCEPNSTGMRDQNIYTSRITQGLFAAAPGNFKPFGAIQRAFAVFVENTSSGSKTFRLTIPPSSQPPGGKASFVQLPAPGQPDPLTSIDVVVAPRSSASRTVFVTSSDPRAQVTVQIAEINGQGNPDPNGLQSSILLNPDLTNPDLTNPDLTNAELYNPDLTNSAALADPKSPDLTNPDLTNPDLTNPDLTNPDLTNPDLTNADITNPDLTNPGAPSPDLTNPDLTNPDLTNPDLTNPDLTNRSMADKVFVLKNNGNTTASYNLKLVLNGQRPSNVNIQLIAYRVYKTPAAVKCVLTERIHNEILLSISDPTLLDRTTDPATPDLTNSNVKNATIAISPGDEVRVAVRAVGIGTIGPGADAIKAFLRDSVTLVVVAQAVNTPDLAQAAPRPPAVASRVMITTPSLPDGVVGVSYSTTLVVLTPVAGADPNSPRLWTITSGSLPPGLALNASGQITGTPTTSGSFSFTVQVTNAPSGQSDARLLSIRVALPLAIATTGLPAASLGGSYTASLQAAGGIPPLTWSIVSGSLPPGLTLTSSTGQISGTPAAIGAFQFSVRVTDSASPGQNKSATLAITVNSAP